MLNNGDISHGHTLDGQPITWEWVWKVRKFGVHAALECGARYWKPNQLRITSHGKRGDTEWTRGIWIGNLLIWWGKDVVGYWKEIPNDATV